MDTQQQLSSCLAELKRIVDDSKAIIEWHKLMVFEKRTNPSARVFFNDNTMAELTDKQAHFQSVWIQADELLSRLNQNSRKIEFQRQLHKLAMQFYYPGSDVRVY